MALVLDEATAAALARLALAHVTREYPHKFDHVVDGPASAFAPRDLHPVFFGSFDWHSCVHGYWLLARLLRRFPAMAPAPDIRALFDAQFRLGAVSAECAFFARPESRGFERPYGWAWLLKLAAELVGHETAAWGRGLAPLADLIVDALRAFLPLATYPVRAGTHGNTAFALRLAADVADATGDADLTGLLRVRALDWYGADRDCQAWEPGGDDFLSPALIEAECLRRLLPPQAFVAWFDDFLPRLADRQPATLFDPVTPTDRSDGKLAHLDGLNLSRAWCWRALATTWAGDDPRRALVLDAADRHGAAGLAHVSGDYMGEHWLASFAVLALDEPPAGPPGRMAAAGQPG